MKQFMKYDENVNEMLVIIDDVKFNDDYLYADSQLYSNNGKFEILML